VLDLLLGWIGSGQVAEYEHNEMAEYVIRDQGVAPELLNALAPYLVVKRKHAEIGLSILRAKQGKCTLESLEEMRRQTLSLRALNRYPKRLHLDPVTTEAEMPRR
jgi:hypothetical protein